MKIALDAMGGDLGPEVTVDGAAAFVKPAIQQYSWWGILTRSNLLLRNTTWTDW